METTDVLVVEDFGDVAILVVDSLEARGYTVARARNPAEGWRLFKVLAPRAVVTDGGMPAATGVQLARRIKDVSPGTPVIMFSGDPPLEANGVCDRVLAKPHDFKRLPTVLEELGVRPGGEQGW